MEIVYSKQQLVDYISRNADVTAGHPILIDQFLEDALNLTSMHYAMAKMYI